MQSRIKLVALLKWTLPTLVVAGLLYLIVAPADVEVDLGTVSEGSMMLTVDEDGRTRIRERYIVSAPLGGRLLRVEHKPGDAITKGGHLATLDPGEPGLLDPRARAQAQARVQAAEAAFARAETQVETVTVEAEQVNRDYARVKKLWEKGHRTTSEYEREQLRLHAAGYAVRAAESSLDVARFELEQARAALLRTTAEAGETAPEDWNFTIDSPIDGSVLRVVEESSVVLNAGAAIMEIGDPEDLEIEIDVLSQDAVKIQPGQRVIVDHWGGAKPLHARVRRVEPSAFTKVSALGVDEQRVYVLADFEDAPGDGESMGDGFRIEARIVIWEKDEVLKVPSGALFRDGDAWAVYRLGDGGNAERTTVTIGNNNGIEAEVLDGLQAGQQVVLHPSDQVADGVMIRGR